jgi:hypothetical protein
MLSGGRTQFIALKARMPWLDINQERHHPYAGYDGMVELVRQIDIAIHNPVFAEVNEPSPFAADGTVIGEKVIGLGGFGASSRQDGSGSTGSAPSSSPPLWGRDREGGMGLSSSAELAAGAATPLPGPPPQGGRGSAGHGPSDITPTHTHKKFAASGAGDADDC